MEILLGLLVNFILAVIVIVLMGKINKMDEKDTYPNYQRVLAFILTVILPIIGVFLLISVLIRLIIRGQKNE